MNRCCVISSASVMYLLILLGTPKLNCIIMIESMKKKRREIPISDLVIRIACSLKNAIVKCLQYLIRISLIGCCHKYFGLPYDGNELYKNKQEKKNCLYMG